MNGERIENFATGLSVRITQDIRSVVENLSRNNLAIEDICVLEETLHHTCELIIPKLPKKKRNEFYDWIHDYMYDKI